MENFVLSCCSTADLSKEHFINRKIEYICFHYELDGKPYRDDLGETMSLEAFYQAMTNGAETKTSQINAAEFEEYFEGKNFIIGQINSSLLYEINFIKNSA